MGNIHPLRCKKLYIICLQFSCTSKLCFPYDIMYLPDGCEANAISFLLPSKNKLHVKTPVKTPQHKLDFNRSYSIISNFNLTQTVNLTSLTNERFQDLAHKILEMTQMSIHSISNMLTKLRAFPNNFWSSTKVKAFSTIGSFTTALCIITLAISLYCKCFFE